MIWLQNLGLKKHGNSFNSQSTVNKSDSKMYKRESKFNLPEHVMTKKVDDQLLIVNTQTDEYHSINQVGADLLEKLNRNLTVEQTIQELTQEYDVPEDQLVNDINHILAELIDSNIIVNTH